MANETTVNSGGHMNVASGGMANETTVNSGGFLYVSSGGTASDVTISTGGVFERFSWGEDHHFDEIVNGSAIVSENVILSAGKLYVSSGGTANATTVLGPGSMFVSSDGTANFTMVNGYMYVASGGTALQIKENGGFVDIEDGANVTFVSNILSGLSLSHDSATVHSGTTANETTVNSSGGLYIAGGTANNTTVNARGGLYVSSGGIANDTTVNVAGEMYISSGGFAHNTILNNASGNNYAQPLLTVNGGIANYTTVNSFCSTCVSSGGTVNYTTVNSSGVIYISSGGTATDTTVNSGGKLTVYSGGTATDTAVNSGGKLTVYSGGTASIVYNPWGGNTSSASGANVIYLERDTNVYIGGEHYGLVSKGNSISYITLSSGLSTIVYSSGTATSTTVTEGGQMTVFSGGQGIGTILSSGGSLNILSGGIISATTVGTGAVLTISNGVSANDTTVNSDGLLSIQSGGTASNITVSEGGKLGMTVASGTYIQGTSSGSAFVMENAAISGYTVNSGNWLDVSSGGQTSDTTVNDGGQMTVSSGGQGIGTIVSSGGSLDIRNGGQVSNTTVNNGGQMTVSSGGLGIGTIVSSGGNLDILSGGQASNTTVNEGGQMTVSNGGQGIGTIVSSGGSLDILSGGQVSDTTVNAGGQMTVSSGGLVSNTAIESGGSMTILDGGEAADTTISAGGTLTISSGGSASDTTVESGAVLNMENGTHTGSLIIEDGGSVNFTDMVLDFTLTGRTPADDYLVNDLSAISGISSYTITISDQQELGIYKLAQGATGFTGSITIKSDSQEYGTVVCNATALQTNSMSFLLKTEDVDNLVLKIFAPDNTPPAKPTASADITTPTNQNVTVTAVFSNDSVRKQYSRNGIIWSEYTDPITVNSNCELYFRGIDEAGNISEIALFEVANITPKPAESLQKPFITVSSRELTNQDVTITAVFDPNSTQNEYCINNGSWISYGSGVVLKSNGLVSFRSKGSTGVYSETVSYMVENIDKTAPVINISSTNTETNTLNPVFVIAEFSDENKIISKKYSFDNTNWKNYTAPIAMDRNTVLYFEAEDAAGNIRNKTFTVSNMTAPQGLKATVQKYNIKLNWMKFTVPKGVKVAYQINCDGKIYTSNSNQYTIKDAAIGTHNISVRAILSNGNSTAWCSEIHQTVFDITPPKAGNLTLTQTDADSVRLNWTAATDNVGIDHYIVTCGKEIRTVSGSILSAEFSGVAGKVDATITAYDAAGNASKTVKKSLKLADVTAPTKVTGLKSEGVDNKSGGILVWNKATDNVGVTQYLIKVDGKTYKSKTNSLKINKLNAGDHKFTVIAVDKEKNQSIVSEECKFTVADVIDPKVTKLAAKVTNDSALVTWKATDETGIAKLELSLDKKQAVDVTKLESYDFAGLSAGIHSLRLTAYDAAGNMAFKNVSLKVKAPKNAGILAAV